MEDMESLEEYISMISMVQAIDLTEGMYHA
jgi:hypothetical protein